MINLPFYYWFGTQGRFLDHVCSCQCHHIDFAIDPLQLRSAHEHCSHLPESKGQTGTRQTKTFDLLKWLFFSFDCLVLMCLLCNAKEKVSHLSFLSSDKKKKKMSVLFVSSPCSWLIVQRLVIAETRFKWFNSELLFLFFKNISSDDLNK